MSCATEAAGADGCAMRPLEVVAMREIGAKSRGWYVSVAYIECAIAFEAMLHWKSV
jgi:hypothetical protein